MVMKGLDWASLKKYPSLIPLYFFVGGGLVMSFAYLGRLAIYNPDVTWVKKSEEPWNQYRTKYYKLWHVGEIPDLKRQAEIVHPRWDLDDEESNSSKPAAHAASH